MHNYINYPQTHSSFYPQYLSALIKPITFPSLPHIKSTYQTVPLVCFPFTSKGPHCTVPCSADADCPAPSPGCSHMGVCKAQ